MNDQTSSSEKNELQKNKHLFQWQNRLLPWMISIPTVLIGAFILLATLQLNKFEKFIYQGSETKTENTIPSPGAATTDSLLKQNMEYLKLYSLVKMEEHSINRRYNQGGVLLMSRIYIKYLGFFTGMILAIVGSVFIISKLKEDVSEIEGNIQDKTKFRLISSSPGIIFGVLGTALMMTTILTHSEISVKDMPLYLNTYNIAQPQKPQGETKKEVTKSKIDAEAVEAFDMETDTSSN
jgi:ABC-type phosphate transport system permease subunit